MATVSKVFRIVLEGGREVTDSFTTLKNLVTKLATEIKKAKQELGQLLAQKADPVSIDKLNRKLADLQAQLKATIKAQNDAMSATEREAKAQKQLNDEIIRLAKSRKSEADAVKAEENARKAKALADKAELSLTQRQTSANMQLAGSYFEIKSKLAQLRPFVAGANAGFQGTFAFDGKQLNFQEAIDEFKRLSFAEQDWRRQFQKFGTNVGDYSKGIVDAFKQMNIDDILSSELKGAQNQLAALEKKTKDLVAAYRQAQQAGSADMNKLEKEIHDNVVETEKLRQSIKAAEVQLHGMGGIGTQITNSLKQGFKDFRNQIGQFVIGFLGFQAAYSGIQKTLSETVALDSLDSSLKAVSGTAEELRINQEFLAETTERLGVVYTDTAVAFKNFYAASTQAGISADETRKIFESATTSAVALKLSQEDVNGILRAFGQIASKGKVQAEELRGQIGERVPGAFAIAARAIGVTTQKLNKMLEDGQVMSNDFLPKFAAELKKTFGVDPTKNVEGLQASLNRLKNTFTSLIQDNQGGLSGFFTAIISGLTFLIKNLPTIISLLTAYAGVWALANANMIAARISTIALSVATTASNAVMLVVTTATRAYAIAVQFLNTAMGRAAVTTGIFGTAIRLLAGPIGIILTIISLITISFVAFGKTLNNQVTKLAEWARQMKINNEIQARSSELISEQKTSMEGWIAVVKDVNASADTKRRAMNELIKIDEKFSEAVKGNIVNLRILDEVYKDVIKSITLLANAEAAAELAAKKRSELIKIQATRQTLEISVSRDKSKQSTLEIALEEEQKELLRQSELFESGAIVRFTETGVQVLRQRFKEIQEFLKKQEEIASDILKDYLIAQTKADAAAEEELNKGAKKTENVFQAFKRLVENQGTEQDFDELLARVRLQQKSTAALSKEMVALRKLEEDIEEILDPSKRKKGGRTRASRLTGEQKDLFKDIEAVRARDLAHEETYFEQRLETEAEYLRQVRDINVDALDAKIARLDGSNAEERKLMAEFELEKIKTIKDTNKKLFELENKQLEITRKNAELNAQLLLDATSLNPELTEEGKLEAREEFFQSMLDAQEAFNLSQVLLEIKYSQESVENEQKRKEAIEKIRKDLRDEELKRTAARVKDIENEGNRALNLNDLSVSKRTVDILKSNESARRQAYELQKLEAEGTKERLAVEKDTAEKILNEKEKAYAAGLIAEREYQEALADYKRKEAALFKLTVDDQLTSLQKLIKALKGVGEAFLQQALGIRKYATEQEKVEGLVKFAADQLEKTIATAYNSYFDREQEKIEKAKELQLGFLEREEERVKAQAQSEEERSTIERKYAQKRKDEERKAFEEQKKLAKKKATIEFAVASIKTFAEFGWPLGLIGVAALGVAFAAQMASINNQQFAKGGKVKPEGRKVNIPGFATGGKVKAAPPAAPGAPGAKKEKEIIKEHIEKTFTIREFAVGGKAKPVKPMPNGRIRTQPNIPTRPNGDNIVATLRVGEVVLNERQQKLLGGAATFRRIGVPGFATGGQVPQLGTSLQAPVFTARNTTQMPGLAAAGEERMARLEQLTERVLAAVYASDQKPVVLNPNAVTRSQERKRKDVELGTI